MKCPHCNRTFKIKGNYLSHIYEFRKEIYYDSLRKRFIRQREEFDEKISNAESLSEIKDIISNTRILPLLVNTVRGGFCSLEHMGASGINITDLSLKYVKEETGIVDIYPHYDNTLMVIADLVDEISIYKKIIAIVIEPKEKLVTRLVSKIKLMK